jgi:FMN phosphatase YigB (HAD superfamily)
MPRKIALIDMDGTIADFEGQLRKDLDKIRNPQEWSFLSVDKNGEYENNVFQIMKDHSFIKERVRTITKTYDWWERLEPIPTGLKVVEMLQDVGFECQILTKGPWNKLNAWTEKAKWCRKYLPKLKITVTEDKSIVYGRILFDDFPEYVEPWLKNRPRGLNIMLENCSNLNFTHTQTHKIKQNSTENELKILREKIEEAYNR